MPKWYRMFLYLQLRRKELALLRVAELELKLKMLGILNKIERRYLNGT